MKLEAPFFRSIIATLIALAAVNPNLALSQPADTEEENPVVATADGVEIRKKVMDLGVLSARADYLRQGIAPEALNESVVRDYVLRKLAAEHLLRNRATKTQIEETLEKTPEIIQEQIEAYGSAAILDGVLKSLGIDREFFDKAIERKEIADRVLNDLKLKADEKIDDEAAKNYYDENPSLFEYPASYRAAHILWEIIDPVTGRPIPSSEKEAKRQEATEVAALAKQEGADFRKLVSEYSDDIRSKNRGGEYSFRAGQMEPSFERAALGLEPGQVSAPVETRFGYHVIKLIKIQPKRTEEFEKVKADIIERLKSDGTRQEKTEILNGVLEKGNFRNLLAEAAEKAKSENSN